LKNYPAASRFMKTYRNLTEVLTDHKLASLGDAYVNFAYSLALSNKKSQPSGAKLKGTALAEALKRAGLRSYMPSRMTSHMLADAAEALIVYAWLNNHIALEETVTTIENKDNLIDSLTQLLDKLKSRIKLS
jgi:Ribonuclease III